MTPFYRYWLLVCLSLCAALLCLSPSRELSAAIAVLLWLGLCWPCWRTWRRTPKDALDNPSVLCIAYATQGGQAKAIAERSAAQLQQAGVACQVCSLASLRSENWQQLQQLLIVASTYGEGEAPDHAASTERVLQQIKAPLKQLDYAVLALGDRQYPAFCAFGKRLDQRLSQLGAHALQDCLAADRCDPAVLRQWQQLLAQLSGGASFTDWQAPDYQAVTLLERLCLNPNSQGNPAYLINLSLPPASDWQAGAILEVEPRNSSEALTAFARQQGLDLNQPMADGQPLHCHLARRQLNLSRPQQPLTAAQCLEQLPLLAHRDYSIASLPTDGKLQLLVRLHQHADGLGCASGWLCHYAAVGNSLNVRIRRNPNFELSPQAHSLILVGNGTGIAGLQAHLREREQLGQHGHWLIFGERQSAHDHFFAAEHQRWLASGHLSRLDLVFSRDQTQTRYVQHCLRDAADELRLRLEQGATLLVCGSLKGMGEAIEELLHGVLGSEALQKLRAAGRYRRDLY